LCIIGVAAGVTLDDRVQVVEGEEMVSRFEEVREYHRRVRWHRLANPITPAKIKELCGQTPLQTVQRVRKGEDELRRLIQEPLAAISDDEDD
jgi:hypothetical protein